MDFNKQTTISYLLLRWFLLVLELLLWLFLLHSWHPAMIWSLLLLEMNSLADKLPAEFLETAEFSAPFWLGGHCGQVSRGWLRWVKTEWAAEEQAPLNDGPVPIPLELPFLVDAPAPLPLELPCLEEAMVISSCGSSWNWNKKNFHCMSIHSLKHNFNMKVFFRTQKHL